jgi:hypothetical protein
LEFWKITFDAARREVEGRPWRRWYRQQRKKLQFQEGG